MKRGIVIGLLCLSICASFIAFGQTVKVVPPTPNAAKMTEYYATQPNMYTGTANVSIPLYTIDFDGWQLPLSLSYNATGIRTSEEASEVGLGWSLSATGVISRTIRGGDDFFDGDDPGFHKGYVYNVKPVTTNLGYDRFVDPPLLADDESYYAYVAVHQPDTEPDIFNYNFFGFSGSFILTQRVIGDTILVKKLTEDATSIMYYEHAKKFVIITPNGFKGEFDITEMSTSASSNRTAGIKERACDELFFLPTVALRNSGRLRRITSWYVSKITSPRSLEIDFTYDQGIGASRYISAERTFGEDGSAAEMPLCLQTIHEHSYLKEITSNDVGIKATFTMSNREDVRENQLFGPASLEQIFPATRPLQRYTKLVVTSLNPEPQSTPLATITFFQSYFKTPGVTGGGDLEDKVRLMRSRLDKVLINDQEYQFSYYNGAAGLPDKQTTSIDHFGFFNGRENQFLLYPASQYNNAICDLRQDTSFVFSQIGTRMADLSYGKAGMLQRVRYPTKGFTEFEYEEHSYLPDQTTPLHEDAGFKLAGGARIKTVREYDADSTLKKTRKYNYNKNGVTDQSQTTGLLMTPLMNLGKTPNFVNGFTIVDNIDTRNECTFVVESNSSIPGNNAAEGKIIGYSEVIETVVASDNTSYKNRYFFENRPNIPLSLPIATEGYTNLNGQVKETRNYGDDGKIYQVVKNSDYEHTLETITGFVMKGAPLNTANLPMIQYYDIKRTLNKPRKIETFVASAPGGINVASNGEITAWNSTLKTTRTTQFGFHHMVSSEVITNSDSSVYQTQYKRAGDYSSKGPAPAYMANPYVNVVEPVIEEIRWLNGKVISANANQYQIGYGVSLNRSYSYNPALGQFKASVSGSVFPSPYELKVDYKNYSDKGKLQEYIASDGIVHSFIWGYKDILPVVHAVGINYSTLSTAYQNTHTDPVNPTYESDLRAQSSLAGTQVSTYDHKPFIGITKATDPNLLKTTFDYDNFGRLKKVIDNDGKTLQQYVYQFKEYPPTRILEIDVDTVKMGTLVPDFFMRLQMEYDRCSDHTKDKPFTLYNSGNTTLHVNSISIIPISFELDWTGGDIPPGAEQKVFVSFRGVINEIEADYSHYNGTITINSNSTNVVAPIKISATYGARICNLSPQPFALYQTNNNPMTMDFGLTTGNIVNQPISIKNTGNAITRINGVPLTSWGGGPISDFEATTMGQCIEPGQTAVVYANFKPTGINEFNAKLSLQSDYCPVKSDIVLLTGEKVSTSASFLSLTPATTTLDNFMSADTSITITLKNRSLNEQRINTITSSDGKFDVLPHIPTGGSISLRSFEEKTFTLKYTAGFDFTEHTSTIVFDGEFPSESAVMSVTGHRKEVRSVALSTHQLDIDPHGNKSVTILNNGNVSITLTGVKFFANGSLLSSSTSWTADFGSVNPVLLPGASLDMDVTSISSDSDEQTIQVQYSKLVAYSSSDEVAAAKPTRIIGISMEPFNTFENGSFIEKNATISNTGNRPLEILEPTTGNSRFVVQMPSGHTTYPVVINPGASKVFKVKYTDNDFLFHETDVVFPSDKTEGAGTVHVTAHKVPVRTLTLNTHQYLIDASLGHAAGDGQTVVATVSANTSVSFSAKFREVNGSTYSNNSDDWTVSFSPSSVSPTVTTSPVNVTITVDSKVSNPHPQVIQIQYVKTNGALSSSDEFTLVQIDRNLTISMPALGSFILPTSVTREATLTNNGNAPVTITSITSNNGLFSTDHPLGLVIDEGSSDTIKVTYNAGTNFTSQGGTISFNSSNRTSGSGTLSVSSQRTLLNQISVPGTADVIASVSGGVASFNITNSGNVDVNINSIGLTDTSPSSYSMKVLKRSGPGWTESGISYPFTLGPTEQMLIEVRSSDGTYTNISGGHINISNSSAQSSYQVNLSRASH